MCGIAGIWKPGHGDLSAIAQAMADAIRHRGPDGDGVWADADAGIALSHRRLAIIDLSEAGRQPMVSASGRYVITYNGEIYNFHELRQELSALGISFRGGSDTEVMLAAIEQWGLEPALARFIGMFALALWDTRHRCLTLVRDRLGIKPLYWGIFGGTVVFASQPGAVLQAPDVAGEIDRDALAAYLHWNYVPAPHSIYRGLHKLEPGSLVELPGSGAARIRRYWDIRDVAEAGRRTPLTLSDEDAVDRLEDLLGDAVGRRMVADVPLGAFLSGGIDSSLVVALMQSRSEQPVNTFSIGFHEAQFDEARYAKAVAAHLGTRHRELYLSADDVIATVPDLASIYDEPFADSSQLPTLLVSRMTREYVTVALTGDGGDELMAGYSRYRQAELTARRLLSAPLPLRRLAADMLQSVPMSAWQLAGACLPERISRQRLGDRVHRLCGFLRQPDSDAIYVQQHTQWPRPQDLLPDSAEPPITAHAIDLLARMPQFIDRMQLRDTIGYLPDDVLTKVDRASMAVALEARVPLLDHRVVELAWQLPHEQQCRDGRGKWLLRQILQKYVPQTLIDRPKMGFAMPIAAWLRGPLRPWAEEMLTPGALMDILDPHPVQAAWQRLLAGHDRYQEPVWGILMFQAWRSQSRAS